MAWLRVFVPFFAILGGALSIWIARALNFRWPGYAAWGAILGIMISWVLFDRTYLTKLIRLRATRYKASSTAIAVVGALAVIVAAWITSQPGINRSFDMTASGDNTPAPQSIAVMKKAEEINGGVLIKAFFSDETKRKTFADLMRVFRANGAKLKIEFFDPRKEPARVAAELLKDPNTVILSANGHEARITTFTEEGFVNAVDKLIRSKQKKIYISSGHGEFSTTSIDQNGLAQISKSLEDAGNLVLPSATIIEGKVPDDADLFILAGPRYDLKAEELTAFNDYLKRGGALLVVVDALVPTVVTNQLTEPMGIKIQNDLLILQDEDPRAKYYGRDSAVIGEFTYSHPVAKTLAPDASLTLIWRKARSLVELPITSDGFIGTVEVIARTSTKGSFKVHGVATEADIKEALQDSTRFSAGRFPVMAVSSGFFTAPSTPRDPAETKREFRLGVVGSSQLISNQGMSDLASKRLLLNMIGYLLRDDDLISLPAKKVRRSSINLTSSVSMIALPVLGYIYPALCLCLGLAFWLMRRRA